MDAARQIARQEGLLGFYKGLVPSLLLVRQKSSYSAARGHLHQGLSSKPMLGPHWALQPGRACAQKATMMRLDSLES